MAIRCAPWRFYYAAGVITLRQVNLVSESGTGPTRRYLFAVSDSANSFTLEYNPFDLSWRLKEMYTDG